MTAQTAADLRAAAAHIDRVGLNQDGGSFRYLPDQGPDDCQCCVMGAAVIIIQSEKSLRWARYYSAVQKAAGVINVFSWNDDPATTKADVIAVLHAAADNEEAQQ